MEDKQFQALSEKIDTVIKLLGVQVIGGKGYREQVEMLTKAGLQPKEIATLTGKTSNNVKVTQHLMRKSINKGGNKDE
jgi:hypothetical protein